MNFSELADRQKIFFMAIPRAMLLVIKHVLHGTGL